MACLERFYKQNGVGFKISKNGKKHIAKAVYFLEGQWKKKITEKSAPELDQFDLKADMYQAFIEYAFRNVPKSDLNLLKRLHYSGTKKGWKGWLTQPNYQFNPVLLRKETDKLHFMSLVKADIPPAKDLAKSGYWYTVKVFLKNRWDNKDYPIAKQVLFALEVCIAFMLFRKVGIEGTDVTKLLAMHHVYAKQYNTAVVTKRLDDLAEFVRSNKMQSTLCHNCLKKDSCAIFKSDAVVVNCTQRMVA